MSHRVRWHDYRNLVLTCICTAAQLDWLYNWMPLCNGLPGLWQVGWLYLVLQQVINFISILAGYALPWPAAQLVTANASNYRDRKL